MRGVSVTPPSPTVSTRGCLGHGSGVVSEGAGPCTGHSFLRLGPRPVRRDLGEVQEILGSFTGTLGTGSGGVEVLVRTRPGRVVGTETRKDLSSWLK